MRVPLFAALSALALWATALPGCSRAEPAPEAPAFAASDYAQAIADIARTQDVARDSARKPGELLAFAQLRRGQVVGDFIMGGGYITRLLAMAVGADGRVYAFQPEEFIAFRPAYAKEQDEAIAPYADEAGTPVRVFPLRAPLAAPGWPEPLDTIITITNFHDLYAGPGGQDNAARVAAMLFDALKPGGILVVVDHRAAEGAGAGAAQQLHRMDPALALATLTGAGFVLEAQGDLYARPQDPGTANVFAPEIRGQTDQFAWRLRKPA